MFILIFIIGTIIGSYLHLIAWRTTLDMQTFWSRSKCDTCEMTLSWHQLIPIISFFYTNGYCQHCQQKISFAHPIIECLSGLLACFLFATTIIFDSVTVVIIIGAFTHSISDFYYMQIQPRIFYIIATLSLFCYFFTNFTSQAFYHHILFTLYLLLLFKCLTYIFSASIGGGDIKLILSWSLLLPGKTIILMLMIASMGGLFYFSLQKKCGKIPFIPFLTIGLLISLWIQKKQLI